MFVCSLRSTLPATFYVVRRVPHLFFSHSTPGTGFLDALRISAMENYEEIARRFSRRNAMTAKTV